MSLNDYYVERITKWSGEKDGEEYLNIQKRIGFLSDYLYYDFEPSVGYSSDFQTRLVKWLQNVDEENYQKLLLKLVPKIFYLGREEFNCLYKTVFSTQVLSWLVEKDNKNFEEENYLQSLDISIDKTWFCPITDSFRISQFYHVNQITSKHTFRPDWRSLKKFGDKEKIVEYILNEGVERLVLLEDFVGSGTQVKSVVEFACDVVNDSRLLERGVSILFVPLIICPKGVEKMTTLVNKHTNFSFKTVISINEHELINAEVAKSLPGIIPYVDLITATFAQVKGSLQSEELKNIQKFGFKNTGGLIVMYTNTPNNSLPLIFVESDTWSPLFKRHFRD